MAIGKQPLIVSSVALFITLGFFNHVAHSSAPQSGQVSPSEQKTEKTPEAKKPAQESQPTPPAPVPHVSAPVPIKLEVAPQKTAAESKREKGNWWDVPFLEDIKITDVLIAVFTGLLWYATVKLQRSTERLWEEAKSSSQLARAAADAAIRSAEVAEKSLSVVQRAFVFFNNIQTAPNTTANRTAVKEYIIIAPIENFGVTPATDVICNIRYQTGPKDATPVFGTVVIGSTSVLGPKAPGSNILCVLPIKDLLDCWNKKVDIFVFARLEYRDIFNPSALHHHQICARVMVIHDPSEPPPEKHVSYIQLQVYGTQNSSA